MNPTILDLFNYVCYIICLTVTHNKTGLCDAKRSIITPSFLLNNILLYMTVCGVGGVCVCWGAGGGGGGGQW